MNPRTYPLVSALALAASALLMTLPPQALACADAKPRAGTATDPNDPRFAAQMVERYRTWGASR